MRSKMTIVSLREYPIMVKRAAMICKSNALSNSERKPTVNILPGMNAGASTYAVPSPIKGSGTAWVLLGSWALSPARPTPIHPRHECRGLSALFGDETEEDGPALDLPKEG